MDFRYLQSVQLYKVQLYKKDSSRRKRGRGQFLLPRGQQGADFSREAQKPREQHRSPRPEKISAKRFAINMPKFWRADYVY